MAGLGPYRDTIWQTIKGKPKEMIRSMFMDVPGVFFSYLVTVILQGSQVSFQLIPKMRQITVFQTFRAACKKNDQATSAAHVWTREIMPGS